MIAKHMISKNTVRCKNCKNKLDLNKIRYIKIGTDYYCHPENSKCYLKKNINKLVKCEIERIKKFKSANLVFNLFINKLINGEK